MKKKVCLILVLCTIATVLCGCSFTSYEEASYVSYEKADTNPKNYLSKNYFTVIKKWDGGINFPLEQIVYANDTGVMYYVFLEGYRGGITPLYNADGTLQIWEGE